MRRIRRDDVRRRVHDRKININMEEMESRKLGLRIASSTASLAFPPPVRFCLAALRLARLAVPSTLGRSCEAQAR
jgi:hypothetical protein